MGDSKVLYKAQKRFRWKTMELIWSECDNGGMFSYQLDRLHKVYSQKIDGCLKISTFHAMLRFVINKLDSLFDLH